MKSRDIIRSLMTNQAAVVYFKDQAGRFTLVNRSWISLYQVDLIDIVGNVSGGHYTPAIAAEARKHELQVEASGEPLCVEERMVEEDGVHTYLATCFPVHDEAGNVIGTGTFSTDITDRKRLEQDLRAAEAERLSLAQQDLLTNTFSRKFFYERLEAELLRLNRYHRPLSLLLIDLNQFGAVNRRFGHRIGDQVLVEVVAALNECLRETDLLCRFEGNTFAVVALETDQPGALVLAERVQEALRKTTFSWVETITATIGLLQVAEESEIDWVIAELVTVLEQAKGGGHSQILVSEQQS